MGSSSHLTCFTPYDVRGIVGENFGAETAELIGRAVAQHLNAKWIVIGYDARATSEEIANATVNGINLAGANVLDIGLAGTEEVYWAVTLRKACAGIMITASHNPAEYNGMKIVKKNSLPLESKSDLSAIKRIIKEKAWNCPSPVSIRKNVAQPCRASYVDKILSFIDIKKMRPLRIVVNSGNGVAGPTFDKIEERILVDCPSIEFIKIHHNPDPTFPNGIPNPLLPENRLATVDKIRQTKADIGIAFDGDFDRCFFFDELGQFIPGEYIVGLLAESFLKKFPQSAIVLEPRAIFNVLDVISTMGGRALMSKTGHAFMKATMRQNNAVYGGEVSGHHYFKNFGYCDSGMITWLLIAERLSSSGQIMSKLIEDRRRDFLSSGERNFTVDNADRAIVRVIDRFEEGAMLDYTDGVSMEFPYWRFNLRKSNTEPLVRLNVEARGGVVDIDAKVLEISKVLLDGQESK